MNKYLKYSFGILVLGGISYLSFYTLKTFLQAQIDSKYTKLAEATEIFKNVK